MLPAPSVNADSMECWAQARNGRLYLRRCATCGQPYFPPRRVCPACWSERLEWIEASGFGTVHTFTVMHRAPVPAFASCTPYVVALVDLAEGLRMMPDIVGEDAQAVAIGDRVQVCYEDRGQDRVPQFRRVQA